MREYVNDFSYDSLPRPPPTESFTTPLGTPPTGVFHRGNALLRVGIPRVRSHAGREAAANLVDSRRRVRSMQGRQAAAGAGILRDTLEIIARTGHGSIDQLRRRHAGPPGTDAGLAERAR